MDIWLLPNGKVTGETVTRFDANQAGWQSQVKRDHPTARKLMRLHINDMMAIGEGGAPSYLEGSEAIRSDDRDDRPQRRGKPTAT